MFKSLISCNKIAFSSCAWKRFHRVPKKKQKALKLAAKGISAEIAQLGERQTEDLNVPGSIPGFGKWSSKKTERGIETTWFFNINFDVLGIYLCRSMVFFRKKLIENEQENDINFKW